VLVDINSIFCQPFNCKVYNCNGISEFACNIVRYQKDVLIFSKIEAEQAVTPIAS